MVESTKDTMKLESTAELIRFAHNLKNAVTIEISHNISHKQTTAKSKAKIL